MSLYNQFRMSSAKSTQGIAIEYAPNADGSIPSFTVARMSKTNSTYTKELERQTRPYRRQIELETLSNETAQIIQVKVFVNSVLLGWSNVQDKDGKTIVFNAENAIRLFAELPELFDDLQAQATKASLFREDAKESDSKN